jgi:hypothetical protein
MYTKGQRGLKLKCSEIRCLFFLKSNLLNRRILLLKDLVAVAFEKLNDCLLN